MGRPDSFVYRTSKTVQLASTYPLVRLRQPQSNDTLSWQLNLVLATQSFIAWTLLLEQLHGGGAVFIEQAIERSAIDAQGTRCLRLVAMMLLEYRQHMRAIE